MEDLKLANETEVIKPDRTALVVIDLQLRRRGIDTIVLCGVSTGIGVDTTAREAFQQGYNQIFVEDAMAAITKEEHDYVCKYIFPRIGKIRTTENIESSIS
ncbi:isochorismatase family protein YecD [Clostridium magnum DSM 2767]|uniref:Isochorismatase family protein YecD n=1 Tax=Clostridium magnum DSM 2767 TaxID=1121326 RepID=A0A162QXF9_9CLOT|nr:isochorismatase family protein YecD [Clostridium magnum DSM 2767]SHI29141.1 Isochorismatase family protein [Clostridium magnum DSM 2767]